MVSYISVLLWFCDLEVMFHMITMTFATFEKKKTFFSLSFFLIKKIIKASFAYGIKSENTL